MFLTSEFHWLALYAAFWERQRARVEQIMRDIYFEPTPPGYLDSLTGLEAR